MQIQPMIFLLLCARASPLDEPTAPTFHLQNVQSIFPIQSF